MIPKSVGKNIFNVAKSGKITAKRIKQLESKSDHDTAALVEALSEKCKPEARPWIHYGLTSNDLVDTSNSMQIKDALSIIEPKVGKLSIILAKKAIKYKNLPAVGRTHGQHTSIISFGLKFANWASEMSLHIERIEQIKKRILICKTLGVVGTGSFMGSQALEVQKRVAKRLGLYPAEVATQIIPRERYAEYIFQLALTGSTLEKIAVEIRHLQRTEVLEVEEYFSKGQKGSSAMPHKRNPIISERVSGLARILRSNSISALENVALWHERDISHSSVERITIPDSCIALDYMLDLMIKLIDNLIIYPENMLKNLNLTRGLVYSQTVLLNLIDKGITREAAYKIVQTSAMQVWDDKNKNLKDELLKSDEVLKFLNGKEIEEIFNSERMLDNIDYIFNRSIYADD
ncbi:MAG: adenylosuccinate lyase [Bacteroidetes bacterium]|nr:adenylosuccinate lyase [Bacteroidota bacterium]